MRDRLICEYVRYFFVLYFIDIWHLGPLTNKMTFCIAVFSNGISILFA